MSRPPNPPKGPLEGPAILVGVKFGYGLITAQRPPDDPRTDVDLYGEAIERTILAERVGFDSAWVSEHHFLDDGYMPSLLVTCAALAQATERITIGTAVLLAPLYHPLRLAEDAATVQLISNGRFILGIGAGWRPEEFEVFGTPLSQRGKRMTDTVRILREAWSGGLAESGDLRVNVTPKPSLPIPIWIGGFAPGAVKRAGRIADGFLGSSSGTSGLDAFVQAKELALEARGREDDFTFALHVPVYVGEWDDVKQHYHYLRWKYPDMAGAHASTQATSPPPLGPDTEEQLRPTIICGSADEVVAEIEKFREALGDDVHFIFRSDFPGMPSEQQFDLIERIGSEVLPQL